jgi:myo-inositol-1(or 4)-monophosphatase
MPPLTAQPEIDPTFCAIALRTVTDELARQAWQPRAGDQVADIIPRLFEISAHGRAMLKALLDLRYPGILWGADEKHPHLSTTALRARCWIYDPIDGAYHFIQGLPLWSASLALVEDGEVVFALVYDPTCGELYAGCRGYGATLNGQKLGVSAKRVLSAAVVGTGLPIHGPGDPSIHSSGLEQLAAVSRNVFVVRQMASASLQLAYVAAGRLDAYWEAGRDLHDWAAGALLVREAGGVVTDFDGRPFGGNGDGIIAAPQSLLGGMHDAISIPRQSSTSSSVSFRNPGPRSPAAATAFG